MTSFKSSLELRWSVLTDALGVTRAASGPVFADLCRRYAEPSRTYHTLAHVARMLQTLEGWRPSSEAAEGITLRLAVWFHDAVYDSRATDNEEQSAGLAHETLASWGVSDETRAAVERLILATKTHTLDMDDREGALLLDADLAILGSEATEYDCYRSAIRQEFAWVPEDAYRVGRGRVLRGFLARPRIYRTPPAFDAWEDCARRNLRTEIETLNG